MREIALTKGRVALVDEEDFESLNQFKWYASTKGYACRDVHVDGKKITKWMHRSVVNAPVNLQVDHINHDKLDNKRENLRLCTNAQNHMNKPPQKGGSSKYKGVYWIKENKKWRAQIHISGKKKSLGCFKTDKEAALAYNNAAQEIFGEFANINIM